MILSCITNQVARGDGGYRPSDPAGTLLLAGGSPARLGSRSSITLSVRHEYHVLAKPDHGSAHWEVEVITYSYSLRDLSGREIVSYHWHPADPNMVKYPHVHLGPAAQIGRPELVKAHLPTGIITIADIVRLAIMEFGVEPRRRDWETILNRGEERIEPGI